MDGQRDGGGDRDFDEFAVVAWPGLRRSAYLLTGDHHLAEDLAQTVLERTYSAWPRVRRADATAYARRVLVNLNVDRLRRRRHREQPVAVMPESAIADADPVGDHDQVVRMLAGLTARERRVVVLRHYYGLREAEVAAELDIAVGTVKSTLHRALGKLRVVPTEPETAKETR